jgi:protein SCO1/2
MYGDAYLPADLEMAVQEAARGEAQPTINKFLRICFNYDPAGRRYVLNVTSVVAIVTILAASLFVTVLVRGGRRRKAKSEEQR